MPALALLLSGVAAPAQSQDLAAHQPLEVRHVCAAQAIFAAPAGRQAGKLAAGDEVLLRDVTFGPDGTAWFALDYATDKGLERAVGYLPVAEVTHFCPAPPAALVGDRAASYLAPPNTCHLVAGYEDTLEGLNDLAASLPAFGPSASGIASIPAAMRWCWACCAPGRVIGSSACRTSCHRTASVPPAPISAPLWSTRRQALPRRGGGPLAGSRGFAGQSAEGRRFRQGETGLQSWV